MIDRENGEETFVVINTTGEPLSRTQNLKPLMVGENDDDAFLWKKWKLGSGRTGVKTQNIRTHQMKVWNAF